MFKYIACVACTLAWLALSALPAGAAGVDETYRIEAVHRDEVLIIDGAVFRFQTYCYGWEKDDEVVFISGRQYGMCTSAELYNLDRRTRCKVWCE